MPRVILNAAMTLDGKIATREGDSQISSPEDLDRTHRLRARVDAIMVGIGTVLVDDPLLTARRVDGENPVRIVVDSEAKTPSDSRVLDGSAPTIVCVSERAEEPDVERLRSLGAQVVVTGRERVDLRSLMDILEGEGIDEILLEGGSDLNWSMLNSNLVDEVRIAVKDSIVGGMDAKTLAGGKGVPKISDGVSLKFKGSERLEDNLILEYEVEESESD